MEVFARALTRPVWIGVAIALALLGVGLTTLPGFLGREEECRAGGILDTEWLVDSKSAPRIDGIENCSQIDPDVTPHTALARIRHSGNRTYAEKCRRQRNHMHSCASIHAVGANGYFHDPARQVNDDTYEVVTTAVLVHPAAGSKEVRDRHFLDHRAAMILEIFAGSAAERGGLRVGDLVVRAGGKTVGDGDCATRLRTITQAVPRGESITLEVLRGDEIVTLTLTRDADLFGYVPITVPVLEGAR